MKIKTILLCTMGAYLSTCPAYAQNVTSGPRYIPRAEISDQNETPRSRMEDYFDMKAYEDYEQREPCQNYRRLPRNYTDLCARMDEGESIELVTAEGTTRGNRLLPIIHSYTILFDFDKSSVRADEGRTLDLIMNEIKKYDPAQITVTGYTDSSGPADYNNNLSREREHAVSQILLARGIESQTIAREARGEYEQAVATPDGTKNQENRRVVVDFRR